MAIISGFFSILDHGAVTDKIDGSVFGASDGAGLGMILGVGTE